MHLEPGDGYSLTDGRIWWLDVVARLKPGVSMARARAESGVRYRQPRGALLTIGEHKG